MEALGFDVGRVVAATGTAPLAPVAKNDMRAIGRASPRDPHCLAKAVSKLPAPTSGPPSAPFICSSSRPRQRPSALASISTQPPVTSQAPRPGRMTRDGD